MRYTTYNVPVTAPETMAEGEFNRFYVRGLCRRAIEDGNRHGLTGDVVAEPRYKRVDKALKRSFAFIYAHGTENIPPNIGLQLVDLIAYPSHQGTKAKFTHQPAKLSFGSSVYGILEKKKYSRNPKTLVIDGWGQKWLP